MPLNIPTKLEMKTFGAVDDAAVVAMIGRAKRRIVSIAPRLNVKVAAASGKCFSEIDNMDVTVVLDSDEDVHRIGYGEVAALVQLHAIAQENELWLKSQPRLCGYETAWARGPRRSIPRRNAPKPDATEKLTHENYPSICH